jgi:hypothetical protein
MTVVLFPNAPTGERPNGAFVANLPIISVTREPQLYHGVDAQTEAAVFAELAIFMANLAQVEASIDRLVALLKPFRVEA